MPAIVPTSKSASPYAQVGGTWMMGAGVTKRLAGYEALIKSYYRDVLGSYAVYAEGPVRVPL